MDVQRIMKFMLTAAVLNSGANGMPARQEKRNKK